MSQHTLEIELFGALKRYRADGIVDLTVTLPIRISELRTLLANLLCEGDPGFNPDGIFKVAAFATETAVLPASAVIDAPTRLAVIPPVSGG